MYTVITNGALLHSKTFLVLPNTSFGWYFFRVKPRLSIRHYGRDGSVALTMFDWIKTFYFTFLLYSVSQVTCLLIETRKKQEKQLGLKGGPSYLFKLTFCTKSKQDYTVMVNKDERLRVHFSLWRVIPMSYNVFYYAYCLWDFFVKRYFHKFHDFDPNSSKILNLLYRYF